MATTLKLRTDIKKLKGALSSKGLPASVKAKLKGQLDKAQNELKSMQSGAKPRKVSTTKGTQTALTSLQKLVNKKKFGIYKGKGIDLKKDADEGALAIGRRVSKGLKGNQFGDKKSSKGHIYYEYRANRLDVKQPKKAQKYPKLEKGGKMPIIRTQFEEEEFEYADGGMISLSKHYQTLPNKQDLVGLRVYDDDNDEYVYIKDVENGIFAGTNPNDELGHYYDISRLKIKKYPKLEDGGYMAKGGEVRFVDEFTTEDGIEVSTDITEDGKKFYSALITKYPLQRIIPMNEDKNAVVERAKKIELEMIEYLSKNEQRSDKLNQRFYAKGGKVEDELYVYEYQLGQWTVKDKKNPKAYYTLSSKRENAENLRQFLIDNPSRLKYYRTNEYAQGGVTDKEVVESNAEMVLSKIKEVHHHADELGNIVSKKSDIEAWVVAKIERASTDLSDITHYLDGQHEKMSMGGSINNYVHKMDKK